MKPLLLASIVLAALPLLAAETQQSTPATQPAQQTDSPLVKAAKAPKKRKATIVITNDTLIKSGGHLTTTASQAPLPPAPPLPNDEQVLAERHRKEVEAKAAADRAAAEKKVHERREAYAQRTMAEQEGATDESLFDDPAVTEHRAEQVTTTTEQKKPPV